MLANDNHAEGHEARPSPSDDHGRAALLLVESLIHGLREKSILTISEAFCIAETAAVVQLDHADAADDAEGAMVRSYELLSAIAASLKIDDDCPPARSGSI